MTQSHDDAVQQAQDWLAGHGVGVEHGVRADAVLADPLLTAQPATTATSYVDGPDADAEAVARAIVIRKLTGQPRTRRELERALAAKAVPEEAGKAVLDRLEAAGLVDDSAFAESWVTSRQQRRHLSSGALRRELRSKGVDPVRIESALEGVDSEEELRAARGLVDKKLRSLDGNARDVQYRRLAAALGRRGFGSGIISSVLSEALGAAPGEPRSTSLGEPVRGGGA